MFINNYMYTVYFLDACSFRCESICLKRIREDN